MKELLDKPYPIRFSAAERRVLDAEAKKQYGASRKGGELVRRYVREGLARDQGRAGELPSFEVYKAIADELRALRTDLARIGGNLNQIAHAVNIHDTVNGQSLASCHDELRAQFTALVSLLKSVANKMVV